MVDRVKAAQLAAADVSPLQAALIDAGRVTKGALGAVGIGGGVPEDRQAALDALRQQNPIATTLGGSLPALAIPAAGVGLAARAGTAGARLGAAGSNKESDVNKKFEEAFKRLAKFRKEREKAKKKTRTKREPEIENLGPLQGPTIGEGIKEAAKEIGKEAGKAFAQSGGALGASRSLTVDSQLAERRRRAALGE